VPEVVGLHHQLEFVLGQQTGVALLARQEPGDDACKSCGAYRRKGKLKVSY